MTARYIHDGYGKERAVCRLRGLRNLNSTLSPVDDCAKAGQRLRKGLLHSGPTRSTWSLLIYAQHERLSIQTLYSVWLL